MPYFDQKVELGFIKQKNIGSSEVRCLLLDLDPYGGTDLLGKFRLFLKRTTDVLAPSS